MAKKYWLIKSEPNKYPWSQLVDDGSTVWDGIRNYTARLNLMAMQKGDLCLFYHSNIGKEIVGIAEITREAFNDPTASEGNWKAVEVSAQKALKNPVSLAVIKDTPTLANMELVKISRLSVSKVSKKEYDIILKMSQ